MRKLVSFNMITLDGFFEGPSKEIDWHNVDEEFSRFSIEQIKTVDMMLFGRVTYQLMKSYWPTVEALTNEPIIANLMNTFPKIVFSRTLATADWHNTQVVQHAEDELEKLKRQEGKDLIIFGSANLTSSLLNAGLIDELRIVVNPVILGKGRPLFEKTERRKLNLLNSRTFKSGNVLLCYQPVQ